MTKRMNFSENDVASFIPAPFGATTEEWRKVAACDGYFVSSLGRIASARAGQPRLIKLQHNRKGYQTACIASRNIFVHKLVAIAFIPNPNHYAEINHKDEVKDNNRVENLEWCTRYYNIHYGTGIARCVAKMKKPVLQYSITGKLIREWDSALSASSAINVVCSAGIVRCCNHINAPYATGGYIWLYKKDADREIKLRNKVAWLSQKRNALYGKRRPVSAYNKQGEFVGTYPSIRSASRATGENSGSILWSIQQSKPHNGLLWRDSSLPL